MVEMKNKINNKNCPDIEFLSAFFDGELDSSTDEFKHIKDCAECKKHLESYQELADSIKGELSAEVPDNLAERIISGVKRRNKLESQPSSTPFPILLKFAAMVILIGCILYLVLPKEDIPQAPTDNIGPKPQFLNKNLPIGQLTTLDIPSRKRIEHQTGTIDISHFFPASTNGSRKISFVQNDDKEKPAWIANNVKQVWMVKDINAAMNEMVSLANGKKIINKGKNTQGDGELNLKLTKLELVNLVRKFHNAGFKLLSPTQPQPEQNTFAGNQNDEVNYEAVLTQK